MSIGPKNPYRRKNLADISYRDRVIAHFASNFVAMATGGRWAKMQLATLHSMAHHRKHLYRRKNLADISYTDRVIAFLSQILLPWQRGSIGGKCDWQHSMAHPRKPPIDAKISQIFLTQTEL